MRWSNGWTDGTGNEHDLESRFPFFCLHSSHFKIALSFLPYASNGLWTDSPYARILPVFSLNFTNISCELWEKGKGPKRPGAHLRVPSTTSLAPSQNNAFYEIGFTDVVGLSNPFQFDTDGVYCSLYIGLLISKLL